MTQLINYSIPRIVVSGLRGGSGKTILSLSLIAIWHRKGIKVTPFKKGPDYIDAGWLVQAAEEPCFNLDLFMMSPEQVKQSFISHTLTPSPSSPPIKGGERAERIPIKGGEIKRVPSPLEGEGKGEGGFSNHIAIIEGNRGLYDGVNHEGTYSTAELAKLLNSPVIIIVDCTKSTSTIAALVLGCQKLDPDVAIKGVVLNNVVSKRQESVIQKAINEKCRLPVVGALPRLNRDFFPERHMGLTPFQEHSDVRQSIDVIAELGSKYLDVNSIWEIANEAEAINMNAECGMRNAELKSKNLPNGSQVQNPQSEIKIGVIRDSAFQFYYPENLEELEKHGAEIIEVSALSERRLPDIDALYIGGGFPETHAIALAENKDFRESLLEAIERGLPVYAECGGLMYLGKNLILNSRTYPMVGVLPIVFSLEKRPQAHGYTIIEVEKKNPFFMKGVVLKGHEFHYSQVVEIEGSKASMAFKVMRGKGIRDKMDGICYKNVLATYTHLHALGSPEWTKGMITAACRFRNHHTKRQEHSR